VTQKWHKKGRDLQHWTVDPKGRFENPRSPQIPDNEEDSRAKKRLVRQMVEQAEIFIIRLCNAFDFVFSLCIIFLREMGDRH